MVHTSKLQTGELFKMNGTFTKMKFILLWADYLLPFLPMNMKRAIKTIN